MNKKKRRTVKFILSSGIVVVVTAIYCVKPYSIMDVQNVQNNLVSASGILAGILIGFLSTKLIQLADERYKSKVVLNELADKLTQYRKLLYRLLKSHNFWVYKSHVTTFKREEPTATFRTLHCEDKESEEIRQKFWLDESEVILNHTTIDLYLAMEEITGNVNQTQYWAFDSAIHHEYELGYLRRAEMPAYQIWYYLGSRYAKHTIGQINEEGLTKFERDDMNTLAATIDPKFKDRELDGALVADISNYFYEVVLPEMIRITDWRLKPITKSIKRLFSSLIIVLIAGVVMPLILQVLNLGEVERVLTTVYVIAVIVCLLIFLLDLYGIAIDDEQNSIVDNDRVKYG